MGRRWKNSPYWPPRSLLAVLLLCSSQLAVLFAQQQKVQGCSTADFQVMVAIAGAMDSRVIPGWDLVNSTTANASSAGCCRWLGVGCDPSSGRVTGLNLTGMGLRGTIPDAILGLDQLMVLDVSNNSLRGGVPSGLLRLRRLQALDLSMNTLSGTIRPGPGDLLSIRALNVSFNKFGGAHPVLKASSELLVLDARANFFIGPINATAICQASPRIQTVAMSANSLVGEFPHGFGGCRSLRDLMLDTNAISGGLPDDLFRLSSLERLLVHKNLLTGPLAPGIGNLTDLHELDLSSNGFSGAIPDVFTGLTRLQYFSAASNSFSGRLPKSLSTLSSIQVLNLRNNSLAGDIDQDIQFSGMPNLISLDLGSNLFTGPIPADLSNCSRLQMLNLARNRLAGEIRHEFGNMPSLSFLSLSNNSLSNISQALRTLQSCPNLTALVLTINFHGEAIPVDHGIQGFRRLKVLVIAYCGLYGTIPPWLARCGRLSLLDLSWNRLEGGVPPWIGDLSNLFYLDLSNNSLSGGLSVNLSRLEALTFFNTKLRAGQPGSVFQFFSMQNNREKGLQYNQLNSFPPTIDLSTNNLSGPIPPLFGLLTRLHVLDLSVNHLSGPIPEELSRITSLEFLNLSHNDLTGGIPHSLNNLTFLSKFSVAFNYLDGPIPVGGQFLTFPDTSYEGNSHLCGNPLPRCLHDTLPSHPPLADAESHVYEFKSAAMFAFSPAFLTGFVLGLLYLN